MKIHTCRHRGLAAVLAMVAMTAGCSSKPAPGHGPGTQPGHGVSATPSALERELETIETALHGFPLVRWKQGSLEWEVIHDRGQILCVRHRLVDRDAETDVRYYYRDGRLFAVDQRLRVARRPGAPPARELRTLAFFDPAGRPVEQTTRADGRVLGMSRRESGWLATGLHEVGETARVDADKWLAAHADSLRRADAVRAHP